MKYISLLALFIIANSSLMAQNTPSPVPSERLPLSFDRTGLAKITNVPKGESQVSIIFRPQSIETKTQALLSLGGFEFAPGALPGISNADIAQSKNVETTGRTYKTVVLADAKRVDHPIDKAQVCDLSGNLLSTNDLKLKLQNVVTVFIFDRHIFEGSQIEFPIRVPEYYQRLLNPATLIVFVPHWPIN